MKYSGMFLSAVGYALIIAMLICTIIIFCQFGHLPGYGEPDPHSSGLLSVTNTFGICWLFLHFVVAVQILYLVVKLFVKLAPYKFVIIAFVVNVTFLLLMNIPIIHSFRVWALD